MTDYVIHTFNLCLCSKIAHALPPRIETRERTMISLREPTQMETGGPATRPTPAEVLLQSDVLSIASSIIQTYPSITSAYLFGSYSKGTARPDSDVDIALFFPDLGWDNLVTIGGAQRDLESALGKKVDLTVCPGDEFVKKIKTYWVPVGFQCGPATRPTPVLVLLQSDVLTIASSIIQTYPSITSAYLFGSYAKGTARPDSDVDIALFFPDLGWDNLVAIG